MIIKLTSHHSPRNSSGNSNMLADSEKRKENLRSCTVRFQDHLSNLAITLSTFSQLNNESWVSVAVIV